MALVTSSPRTTFLSLPLEIRLEVYENLIDNEIFGRPILRANDDGTSVEWDGYGRIYTPLPMLLVCRQFRADFAPIVYKSLEMGGDGTVEFGMWRDFFRMIGPTNASYIQDVRIYYTCRLDPGSTLLWHGCPYYWTSADLWAAILEEMYEAGVRPKRVHVDVTCCHGCCAPPPGTWPDYEEVFYGSDDQLYEFYRPHESCGAYTNLEFLRALSKLLGRVERVAFTGDFNPLWPSSLKARFGLETACRGHHEFKPSHSYLGDSLTHWGDHWVVENPREVAEEVVEEVTEEVAEEMVEE
ncbi:hypothetical protein Hte_005932 [Hypoxylon texense]